MEFVTSVWSIQKPSTLISFSGTTVPHRESWSLMPTFRNPRFTSIIPKGTGSITVDERCPVTSPPFDMAWPLPIHE